MTKTLQQELCALPLKGYRFKYAIVSPRKAAKLIRMAGGKRMPPYGYETALGNDVYIKKTRVDGKAKYEVNFYGGLRCADGLRGSKRKKKVR